MNEYLKSIPVPDEISKTYWKGCQRRELMLQKCNDCGRFQFYPRPLCVHCMSSSLKWVRASGRGTVYTFTVTYQNGMPGFAQEVPYVFAIIELAEGVRLTSNIVGCDPEQVYIGMPVTVVFETISREINLPKFRPQPEALLVGK